MTIRDAIDQLLTGETTGPGTTPDPARVMAENGYEDVPSELFGTALVHFSDTAPLGQADALAPVVTRLSPIPFEGADLAPLGEVDITDSALEGSDPYALFASAAPTLTELDDPDFDDDLAVEAEEIDVDNEPEREGQEAMADTEPRVGLESLDDASDADFGSGTIDQDHIDDLDSSGGVDEVETYSNDDAMLDDLAPRFDASSLPTEANDAIEDAGADLFSVEFDESDEADDGIDPDDLDFSD